jgi:hypothetical protein
MSLAYDAWRAGTTYSVVVPVRKAGNRFLSALMGLQIRAQLWTLPVDHLSLSVFVDKLYASLYFSYPLLFRGWCSLAAQPMYRWGHKCKPETVFKEKGDADCTLPLSHSQLQGGRKGWELTLFLMQKSIYSLFYTLQSVVGWFSSTCYFTWTGRKF